MQEMFFELCVIISSCLIVDWLEARPYTAQTKTHLCFKMEAREGMNFGERF